MRTASIVALALAWSLTASAAAAQAPGRGVVAPASGKQRALAVEVEGDGVRAAVCDAGVARCKATDGARFVPPQSARATAAGGTARAVRLAGGHHVVIVEAKGDGGTWSLVLAAPPGGEDAARVVWSGWTGRTSGGEGERRESRLVVEPAGGASRVVTSSRRDDLSLCGRGAWTGARVVDPATLELVPTPAVDPLAGARTGAAGPDEVRATLVPAGEASGSPARLLAPLAGSRPGYASLVDGDPATAWALEAGEGSFETATFVGAPELPITAIEVRLVPPPGKDRGAPRNLLVATPDRLLRVRVPDEVVPAGGVVVRAPLTAPITSRCVAVLLEPPAGGRGAPAAIAEITARTSLDAMTLEQVARGLGGPDGAARAAYLARSGEAGLAAALAAYPTLDVPGQDMARRVIDAAPCATKAPFYVAQLGDRDLDTANRAVDRVARCGEASVAPLLAALEAAPPARVPVLADALGMAAPDRAIDELVRRLASADAPTRAALRTALARAARRSRAGAALERALAAPRLAQLPLVARVDLVRAAAPRLSAVRGGREAFASLLEGADFRTRYLVTPAGAELARSGDPAARVWLERTMTADMDPRLRARAVRAASRTPDLLPSIARAAADPEPRVREAAAIALAVVGEAGGGRARVAPVDVALARGVSDEWTFVREASAVAAASWPGEPRADAAIARAAASDAVPRVRRAALAALGARRAITQVDVVRARAAAGREDLDVRAAAYRALGAMCDRASLEMLTELAARAAAPFNEADRTLGGAAIDALAALHPADLAARLAPLRAPDAPREVRERAARALTEPGRCR